MPKMISVGMGELAVTKDPDMELTCLGLGSCIAIALYDIRRDIGAMAHVLLPTGRERESVPTARYADTGVPLLLARMKAEGARLEDLRAVLCGGAAIFSHLNGVLDIGQRNIAAVRAALQPTGIRILREEVGGSESRTIVLEMRTAQVRLRTVRAGEQRLLSLRSGAHV